MIDLVRYAAIFAYDFNTGILSFENQVKRTMKVEALMPQHDYLTFLHWCNWC